MYSAISEIGFGDGSKTITVPTKVVIVSCSESFEYLILHDGRYSIFAVVDHTIKQILQRVSKNSRKELINRVITLVKFHFTCIDCSVCESKEY